MTHASMVLVGICVLGLAMEALGLLRVVATAAWGDLGHSLIRIVVFLLCLWLFVPSAVDGRRA